MARARKVVAIGFLGFLPLAASCARWRPRSTVSDPTIVITLHRGPCYGSCPIYDLTIRGDGTVVYEGEGYVKVRGNVVKYVEPEVVTALATTLERMGYFTVVMPTECKDWATDHPWVSTSVTYRAHKRDIDDYHGDRCVPKELAKMEDEIDRAAETESLVKCSGKCED
jgi:hypothetical protein